MATVVSKLSTAARNKRLLPSLLVFLGGWRHRRQRWDVIAASPILTNRTGARPQMCTIDVVLAARIFLQFLSWLPQQPRTGIGELLRVKLRVVHCQIEVDVTRVRSRPTLRRMHGVTLRIGIFIDPDRLALEAD